MPPIAHQGLLTDRAASSRYRSLASRPGLHPAQEFKPIRKPKRIMTTRIKEFRQQLGLTQHALAKRIGTNQPQIGRIEAGKTEAPAEVAAALASALGQPLDILFPDAGKLLARIQNEIRTPESPARDQGRSDMTITGPKANAQRWNLRCLLKGHQEPLRFEISENEKRRLLKKIQQEKYESSFMSFAVFDTRTARIALNLAELQFCRFVPHLPREEEYIRQSDIQIYFRGATEPFLFDAQRDSGHPDDEEDAGVFRHIFMMLDFETEKPYRYRFREPAGEDVFIRAGDIALLEVPLWVVEPDFTGDEVAYERRDDRRQNLKA